MVVLPRDVNKLSLEDQQQMYMLEQAMMAQEISIPVYFSRHTEDLEKVAQDLVKGSAGSSKQQRNRQKSSSALGDIINTVSANGYQVVVSGASHAANKQSKINIIQGELAPASLRLKTEDSAASGKLPTIIITAQLQTLGLINQQVKNEDVSVLLTLVDAFSKLYNTATTAPKYRIMFLVTESNHLLNFQGTKKWLDTNFDDNSQVNNVEFVVCLDAISRGSDALFMHVSKPPKEGTHIHAFFKSLKATAKRFSSGESPVEGVHKKINLADVLLAWEHERFSMKRLPAFTLSNIKVRGRKCLSIQLLLSSYCFYSFPEPQRPDAILRVCCRCESRGGSCGEYQDHRRVLGQLHFQTGRRGRNLHGHDGNHEGFAASLGENARDRGEQ